MTAAAQTLPVLLLAASACAMGYPDGVGLTENGLFVPGHAPGHAAGYASGGYGARLSAGRVPHSYPGHAGTNDNGAGGDYNGAGGNFNGAGGNFNGAGGSYNGTGSNFNGAGGNFSGADGSYNDASSNYNGVHSVYMRNNGYVADNGYRVDTAHSAIRAQSVQAVQGDGDNAGDYNNDYNGDYTGDNADNPLFQYRYEVSDPRTGDSKSKHETRDGEAVTGEYRVLEASGLERIVTYTADDAHGFVAQVRWVPGRDPHGQAVSHQEVVMENLH